MSLLALLAAHSAPGPDPDPPTDPLPGVTWPTARPYNMPNPCVIPTSDGSGQTIHPGVVDLGHGGEVSGYRFWMANTPYPNNDITLENPEVYASHDGQTWVVPTGLTNPLDTYPAPGNSHWSDTDLFWDDAGSRFVLTYRSGTEAYYARTSPDGITWSARTLLFSAGVSQSLVKTPGGKWRLYYQISSGFYREADDPLGPYGPEVACNGINGWHAHVMYDAVDGMYYATANNGIFASRSTDGIVWNGRPALVAGQTYRPCLRRFDADTFHLWYSTGTTGGLNQTWYTRIPVAAFYN